MTSKTDRGAAAQVMETALGAYLELEEQKKELDAKSKKIGADMAELQEQMLDALDGLPVQTYSAFGRVVEIETDISVTFSSDRRAAMTVELSRGKWGFAFTELVHKDFDTQSLKALLRREDLPKQPEVVKYLKGINAYKEIRKLSVKKVKT